MLDQASRFPPHADITPGARRLYRRLPVQTQALMKELLERMDRSAQARSIPVSRTEVEARRDPDEGTERLVIRQWVDLPREQALDHWEKMGRELDSWISAMPEESADLLAERVTFAVYSDVDDAAA